MKIPAIQSFFCNTKYNITLKEYSSLLKININDDRIYQFKPPPPQDNIAKVEFCLVNFFEDTNYQEVHEIMDEFKLRPATVHEVLSFCELILKQEKKLPDANIIASDLSYFLNSFWGPCFIFYESWSKSLDMHPEIFPRHNSFSWGAVRLSDYENKNQTNNFISGSLLKPVGA